MSFFRIFSVMIDDGERKPDTKTKLVLHVKMTDERKIDRKVQVFGYSEELDEDDRTYLRFPIILQYELESGNLYYGGHWDNSKSPSARLNIYDKEISRGNTFTWFYEYRGKELQTIYRMEEITRL